jgi:hypothetical protein
VGLLLGACLFDRWQIWRRQQTIRARRSGRARNPRVVLCVAVRYIYSFIIITITYYCGSSPWHHGRASHGVRDWFFLLATKRYNGVSRVHTRHTGVDGRSDGLISGERNSFYSLLLTGRVSKSSAALCVQLLVFIVRLIDRVTQFLRRHVSRTFSRRPYIKQHDDTYIVFFRRFESKKKKKKNQPRKPITFTCYLSPATM